VGDLVALSNNVLVNKIPGVKGYYILVIEVCRKTVISVRSGKRFMFEPGFYFYIGSAHGPGGLRGRLLRHLRREKKRFWHIDYLLSSNNTCIKGFYILPTNTKTPDYESIISRKLLGIFKPIHGFGCSDKQKDISHLYLCTYDLRKCNSILEKILGSLNVNYLFVSS
jgi:Uri superfamily endonuclease